MNGTDTYNDDQQKRRLKDRIADDAVTRESPEIGASRPRLPQMIPQWQAEQSAMQTAPSIGMDTSRMPSPQIDVANPPQPSLAQRVIGGFEGQPGGGRAGLVGRVARGALGGAFGPTQRQDIEAERLGSQRIGGEMALEKQREAYGLPEQTARIEQQQAGTEQQRLATKILQRRLEMMQQGGGGAGLQDLSEDENALLQSAYATGDPKTIEQAVGRIYSRRSIEGMVGPGTNVYDPNSPGGVSRQFMTRGGQPMPSATQRGAVVPGTLPQTSTVSQVVPTEGGGASMVTKPETRTPMLPGATRGGGGASVSPLPLNPRLPAQESRAQNTAKLAVSQLPYVRNELMQLRDNLGPLRGRMMELGRVFGTDNPARPTWDKLVMDTDAAVSAFSVIHFGARGNWQWLNEFKGNVDAGTLTYPDLVAGWSVLERWLRAYQTYGESRPVDSEVSAPGVGRAASPTNR